MAVFLIDYENIGHTDGMKGIEYLDSTDLLCIFYSQSCRKIRAEYMENIEESGCLFQTFRLKRTGKNALDFYIAAECGFLCQQGERQIAIISKDKGFQAVVDFFKMKLEARGTTLVTASNIESGIVRLNAPQDQARREKIQKKSRMLELSVEQARYEERHSMKSRLQEALTGTKYEGISAQILEYADVSKKAAPRQRYTGSLHRFGRSDGTAIYQILKNVI